MTAKHDLVELLRTTWADLDDLTADLTDEQWRTPVLPGWDVKDTMAHVIGTEKLLEGGADAVESRVAEAVAAASASGADRPHVRNPIGMSNEEWVEHYRSFTPEDLLAEFRTTTAGRLAALEAMTEDDFAAPAWTPAGQGTYASFMRIRLFDCWMHDQDIRHAVDRPGNEGGPAAEASLDEVVSALGYVVGKLGKAPQGSIVTLRLTGPVQRTLHVEVAERATVVPDISREPDVTLSMDSSLFFRLGGGRVAFDEVSDRVDIDGDLEVGRRIASHLAFTV